MPLVARAQERVRRVGVLMNTAADHPDGKSRLVIFQRALQDFGWASGQNLHIETRGAVGIADNYRKYAAELVALDPAHCSQVEDFTLLKEMPLTSLGLNDCKRITDLEFIRGQKLRTLRILSLPGVKDLGPLAVMELQEIHLTPKYIQTGMDILRDMKSLEVIVLSGDRRFAAEEFWKLYDQGKFRD